MKRRHLITGTAALAASLTAGCGANSSGDGPGKLSFWTHTHPPMIEVYKRLIAEYQLANTGVEIEYTTIPNNEFNTKMLTSLSNGTGPDLINIDDSALRGDYTLRNLVAPIDPAAFDVGSTEELQQRYLPGTLGGGTAADGQIYGVPSEFNGTAFAINTAHFADAQLNPDKPPTTWEEVSEQGQKLKAAGHEQAFSFLYLHSGWYAQQYQTLLGQSGGKLAEGKVGAIDQPSALPALQTWVDLARGPKSTADPNVTSREATVPFQDLATGKQSMAVVYPWAMDQIKQTSPDVYEQLKVVPLPQLNPAAPVNRVYSYSWAVNRASKRQAAAWKFVSFLASKPQEFLSGTDFVQPIRGWEELPAAKEMDFIDVWAKSYGTGRFDAVTARYAEVQDVLTEMINSAVFDGVPVNQAASTGSQAITRILQS